MIVLIKGAGDLATGINRRLKRCGFDIVMTEIERPTTVRRTAIFSQSIYDKEVDVEGVKGVYVACLDEVEEAIKKGIYL